MLKPIQMEVAMKFTSLKHGIAAEKEYEAYSYLNAINNTAVEQFGIPTVYFYGAWSDYVMLAITLMDLEYRKMCALRKLTDVDILIVAREFVCRILCLNFVIMLHVLIKSSQFYEGENNEIHPLPWSLSL